MNTKIQSEISTKKEELANAGEPFAGAAGFFCRSEVTGHRALFYQYRKYPKHLQKLTLGLIRPKQKFFRPKVSF